MRERMRLEALKKVHVEDEESGGGHKCVITSVSHAELYRMAEEFLAKEDFKKAVLDNVRLEFPPAVLKAATDEFLKAVQNA